MSYIYCLISIENKQVLDLGKIINQDEGNNAIPWRFSGFGMDLASGQKLSSIDTLKLMERFLILNRNNEIRVVPQDLILKLDPEGTLFEYIDVVQDLFDKPVIPEPDYERDFELASKVLKKRL